MSNHRKRMQGLPVGNKAEFFRPTFDRRQVMAQLVITVMANGQTKVEGPLGNRALCEAILQDAYNVIKAYSPTSEAEEQKPDSGIVVEKPLIIVP